MFSIIILSIIAIIMCISIITYYRERKDLVQQLRNINYSLSEMRTNIDKIERIDNKMIAIENKVQNDIDKTASIKHYISNNIVAHLTSIKAGQDIYISKLDSKTNKLQNTIDDLVKENVKISEALVNTIKKTIADCECNIHIKLNTINERLDTIGSNIVVTFEDKKEHCEAKNSSKTSKVKNTTETNKRENNKLKTAK